MERLLVYLMSKKFSLEEMEGMENLIHSFFEKEQITLSAPVDIFKLATKLGFDVRAAKFPREIEGLIIVDEESGKFSNFHSSKIIGYNIRSDLVKNRFVVAHELAHYIDEKMSSNNDGTSIVIAAREPCSPSYSNNADEQRKDYMAAAILIPKDDLLERIPPDKSLLDDSFYENLAEFYRVDIRLAKRRVEEVSLWQVRTGI